MRTIWSLMSNHHGYVWAFLGIVALGIGGGLWSAAAHSSAIHSGSATKTSDMPHAGSEPQTTREEPSSETKTIVFPEDSWAAARLTMQPVRKGNFPRSVDLTGKIALNEDRVAHIYPLVDGRVEEVKVHLGDKVKKGDLLVVVQSTEVGKAKLQLFQDRMQRDFAITKDLWTQTVATNTQAMIKLIRSGAALEEIEAQLTDRPMGDYRDRLITAFVASYKARTSLDRLTPLASGGTITGRQLLEATSEWNAARATLQSLLEQLQQETQQAASISTQSVRELETRVAIDETNLKILGFNDDSLKEIDPLHQGEAVSHYPIYAPFDGTIFSKDVVLFERVETTRQILSIADLSTVWVTTDIYEEHLPLLDHLEGQTIHLQSPAWPGKNYQAQIFYTGDLLAESSRTVAMRALAENPQGQLHPGMFVTVNLPLPTTSDVLQVPLSAVLDHAGKSFVFVHLQGDQFERRDVIVKMQNQVAAQIESGLQEQEQVVVTGGFALKSRMLAELLDGGE